MAIEKLSDDKKVNYHEIAVYEIKRINLAVFKGDFANALQWIKEAKQKIRKNSIN